MVWEGRILKLIQPHPCHSQGHLPQTRLLLVLSKPWTLPECRKTLQTEAVNSMYLVLKHPQDVSNAQSNQIVPDFLLLRIMGLPHI